MYKNNSVYRKRIQSCNLPGTLPENFRIRSRPSAKRGEKAPADGFRECFCPSPGGPAPPLLQPHRDGRASQGGTLSLCRPTAAPRPGLSGLHRGRPPRTIGRHLRNSPLRTTTARTGGIRRSAHRLPPGSGCTNRRAAAAVRHPVAPHTFGFGSGPAPKANGPHPSVQPVQSFVRRPLTSRRSSYRSALRIGS